MQQPEFPETATSGAMRIDRVPPVHQCPTEIFRPDGALYRRRPALSDPRRRSTCRKPPGKASVSGSNFLILKHRDFNRSDWLGD